ERAGPPPLEHEEEVRPDHAQEEVDARRSGDRIERDYPIAQHTSDDAPHDIAAEHEAERLRHHRRGLRLRYARHEMQTSAAVSSATAALGVPVTDNAARSTITPSTRIITRPPVVRTMMKGPRVSSASITPSRKPTGAIARP